MTMKEVFFALASGIVPGFRKRAELRAAWGQEGKKDGWLASRSFDLLRSGSVKECVDDKTWSDLEFPRLFSIIDSTVTPLGAQYLYKQLRTYEYDPDEIAKRQSDYEVIRNSQRVREEMQFALTPLDTDSAAHVADVLWGPSPGLPKYQWIVFVLSICSILALSASVVVGLTYWIWIGILAANAALIAKWDSALRRNTNGLAICRRMLGVADRLAGVESEKRISILQTLRAETARRSQLRRDLRLFSMASFDSGPVAGIMVALNVCFLIKLIAYVLTIDRFKTSRSRWISTFELVGAADASIAVANFLQRMPVFCRPAVVNEANIRFEGMYHPLLTKPKPYALELENRSALVTGSNMAGKTTFVKSVGINIVLGHTLGICLASSATIPRSGVMASIRGDQSVESGESRYQAEVRAIMKMIDCLSRDECRVFVLDEPFSGTNTTERIAIAQSLLNAMSQRAQVLVTTHDVELQHLLAAQFDMFHFREDPDVDGFFDYLLRAGASTQRNAIKVLARMGFPDSILANALSHIEGDAHKP